jgi:hypothetical protein
MIMDVQAIELKRLPEAAAILRFKVHRVIPVDPGLGRLSEAQHRIVEAREKVVMEIEEVPAASEVNGLNLFQPKTYLR